MPQLLNLARAARLVGVTRGALQMKIRAGELVAIDGMVSVDELGRLFPDVRLEEQGLYERVTRIKEESFGKRVRDRILPSRDILAQRLFEQSMELTNLRAHLQRYHALVVGAGDRLRELADNAPIEARSAFAETAAYLEGGLQQIIGHSEAINALAVMDDMLKVMTAQVVIRPSNHEFFVDGADSILEAALHAGYALNYGCSSGNCGLCKARVVSGQVRTVRHHDYVLSEAEKLQGYALLCSTTAVSDLIIEALEATAPSDIPQQQIPARVKSITRLGNDIMLLHLQTPRFNRLRFFAGQSVTLSADGAEPLQLPLASCPCDDRNLHFHVERNPRSGFAEKVFHSLRPGDQVTVWGPWGDFVLNGTSPRSVVFLAVDTGFAPIKSLIEHAMALDVAEQIHLYWLATRPDGHYLSNVCRSWADALDNFHCQRLSAPGASAQDAAQQLIAQMRHDLPQLDSYDIYLAGPSALVACAGPLLKSAGYPMTQYSALDLD